MYKNYMVDVQMSNEKLVDRGVRIVCDTTGCSRQEALKTLEKADYHVKCAIVMRMKECSKEEAYALLDKVDGKIDRLLK